MICEHERGEAASHVHRADWLRTAAVEVVTLLAMAGFLGYAFFSGTVTRFLTPTYVWFVPAAMFLILAMAAARVWAAMHGRGACDCAHTQGVRIPQTACALAIFASLFAAVAVHPTQYSVEGNRKRRAVIRPTDTELSTAIAWIVGETTSSQDTTKQAVAVSTCPTVLELLRAAEISDHAALEGRFVTVIGQCDPREGPSGLRFEIYRLVVTCCVADAQSVAVEVARATKESLDARAWVSVGGVIKFDSPTDPSLPVIHAATMTRIAEPQKPFL